MPASDRHRASSTEHQLLTGPRFAAAVVVTAKALAGFSRGRWKGLTWFSAGVLTVVLIVGCRRGVPVLDTGARPLHAEGTISGTVQGPESVMAIEGRVVEVTNLDTRERQRVITNRAGGFTCKVKPGKYRVELTLRDGESLVKRPGVTNVNRSDVDAHADFIIGGPRASRPRPAGSRTDGLRSPVA